MAVLKVFFGFCFLFLLGKSSGTVACDHGRTNEQTDSIPSLGQEPSLGADEGETPQEGDTVPAPGDGSQGSASGNSQQDVPGDVHESVPEEVQIRQVEYSGMGCPADKSTTQYDQSGLVLNFNAMTATTTAAKRRASALCSVRIELEIPPDRQIAIDSVDTRGKAQLSSASGSGTVWLSVGWAGQRPTPHTHVINSNGPFELNATPSSKAGPCNQSATVVVNVKATSRRATVESKHTTIAVQHLIIAPVRLIECK